METSKNDVSIAIRLTICSVRNRALVTRTTDKLGALVRRSSTAANQAGDRVLSARAEA